MFLAFFDHSIWAKVILGYIMIIDKKIEKSQPQMSKKVKFEGWLKIA